MFRTARMAEEAQGNEIRNLVGLLMSLNAERPEELDVVDVEGATVLFDGFAAVLAFVPIASEYGASCRMPRGAVVGKVPPLPVAILLSGSPSLLPFPNARDRAATSSADVALLHFERDFADGAIDGDASVRLGRCCDAVSGVIGAALSGRHPSAIASLRAEALASYPDFDGLTAGVTETGRVCVGPVMSPKVGDIYDGRALLGAELPWP